MPSSGCTRKWQEHQGRNKFFFNGRCVSSRQNLLFMFTFSLLLLVMCMFYIFCLPFLTIKIGLFVPIFMVILFLLVISTMLRAAFTDPGIIPRASAAEISEYNLIKKMAKTPEERELLNERIVNINGCGVLVKFCITCKIFRPPRSSHCSICDNCVLNFDHHCPWIGNCVGARNFRHFYLFITFVAVTSFFAIICICLHFYLVMAEKDGAFLDSLLDNPIPVVLILPFLASFIGVTMMIYDHTPLVLKGITSYEDYKCTFDYVRNPFDAGSRSKNLKKALCSPEPISFLDKRGKVLPENPYIYVDYKLLEKLKTKINNKQNQY
uniref:Palmitoyltransferase n=1 Tax=Meloidogyne enterolobii TaxID=390850 RepID=A0A6V7UV83_MELEN|nr:unnamed protein product [Meloidogyne enterolobii]